MGFDPRTCLELLRKAEPAQSFGKVNKVVGLVAEAGGISASLGAVCHILPDDGGDPIAAEVVGFRDGNLLFMPYGEMRGVRPGSLIRNSSLPPVFPVGPGLLGRAFDAFGNPLDKGEPIAPEDMVPLYAAPPAPHKATASTATARPRRAPRRSPKAPSHPAAGAVAARTVIQARPYMPIHAAGWANDGNGDQAIPSEFQGKPVNAQPRSHSTPTQAAAKAVQRASGRAGPHPASQKARPVNRPSPAPRPTSANGIIQP